MAQEYGGIGVEKSGEKVYIKHKRTLFANYTFYK